MKHRTQIQGLPPRKKGEPSPRQLMVGLIVAENLQGQGVPVEVFDILVVVRHHWARVMADVESTCHWWYEASGDAWFDRVKDRIAFRMEHEVNRLIEQEVSA